MLTDSEAQTAIASSKILVDVKCLMNEAMGWPIFRTNLDEPGNHSLKV